MENDPVLMAFNTWRAIQVDADGSVVVAANDHPPRSCSVWWAGPRTIFLDRMEEEARARGITLIVYPAPYSMPQIQRAVTLIFDARLRLRQLGFDLQSIAGPTPEFLGLTVHGAPVGDNTAVELSPDIVTAVGAALDDLLHKSDVRAADVRIGFGRVHLA